MRCNSAKGLSTRGQGNANVRYRTLEHPPNALMTPDPTSPRKVTRSIRLLAVVGRAGALIVALSFLVGYVIHTASRSHADEPLAKEPNVSASSQPAVSATPSAPRGAVPPDVLMHSSKTISQPIFSSKPESRPRGSWSFWHLPQQTTGRDVVFGGSKSSVVSVKPAEGFLSGESATRRISLKLAREEALPGATKNNLINVQPTPGLLLGGSKSGIISVNPTKPVLFSGSKSLVISVPTPKPSPTASAAPSTPAPSPTPGK
jgi:hypothetical protein